MVHHWPCVMLFSLVGLVPRMYDCVDELVDMYIHP